MLKPQQRLLVETHCVKIAFYSRLLPGQGEREELDDFIGPHITSKEQSIR